MAREELVKVPAVVLGSRLRGKRKGLKLSQHQLGGEDFSPSYVSAVERGKIRPSLKALYILASRLGEPVTYFLEDEGTTRSADMVEEALMAARIKVVEGDPAVAVTALKPLSSADLSPHVKARVQLALGEAYLANRQPAEALAELQDAAHISEANGDRLLAVEATLHLGDAYLMQHQPSLATEVHRRSLQMLAQGGFRDVNLLLHVYSSLAEGLLEQGRVDEALTYKQDVRERLGDVTDLRTLASALWRTSVEYAQAHDAQHARQYAEKSMCAAETLRTFAAGARMRAVEAAILAAAGKPAEAEQMYLSARETSMRIGEHALAAATSIKMGELAAQREDYARAEALISDAIAQAGAAGDAAITGEGMLALAQLLQTQNKRAAAEEQFRAAIDRLESAGLTGALSNAYFRYGQALVAWGEAAQGSEYLEKAYLRSRQP